MLPDNHLALKQIAGRLIVKTSLPDHFKIPIHVETLELTGDLPNNLHLGLIQAQALHVNKVLGFPTVTFNGLNPRFIYIEKSHVELRGIISDHISKLEITSSSLKDTAFDVKTADNISISQTTIYGLKIFPSLQEVYSLNINFSTMDNLIIPLVKATGDISIFFNKKLSVVNFLDLQEVQGTFGVRGFEIQAINIPSLKEAHALEMNTKVFSINMAPDI
ncbi:hypothetical protein DSO57_1008268 [Entomophthora muscae]|uniref:Uncharacterized protein n=1 Tax=Entomophthora muscae TaxID=34485 RepID=A0ACC2UGV6_9FUNG|nr:hypothetical protein DSO57_1008268 [Entomophthora muscae]